MLFELIAVIVAGIAVAGIVLLTRRFLPAVPRWTAPVLAGLAMIAVSISLEYSWFGRTAATLPETMEVARTARKPCAVAALDLRRALCRRLHRR